MEESQNHPSIVNISGAPSALEPLSTEADLPGGSPPTPLERLGFASPGALPTAESPIQDVLLYALVPHPARRPDLAMVLSVASELEAMQTFAEGPIQVTFEMLARRLRAAVDLGERLAEATRAEAA